ncbi:NtaA/DmoA family FMN-dependent monooxygenase [Naasia sp. SYSU D00948]|uniref:NtaA/DmoA family FMN-dependent monooxygenase n=1 Tax=Naasia sp. SYSU D00948 TaxID=2817379 RepID=UPI001B315AE8|nr:NtaA/DmoA family FMN-dependent monooxygenase [Naasia sp. SYSU D00948]
MTPLHFGVFEVMGPQVGGTYSWAHPLSSSIDYADPEHWIRIARLLDEAGFDFLFFADGYGYPIVGDDISEVAIRKGINFSGLDPMLTIPLLARATERLGFVVTSATGLGHPVQTARRFGTLDHLTQGRIGWNIVTGSSQNAVAELFGHRQMTPHDTRYAIAEEYVSLAGRYWEQGWDDDALLADRDRGEYADPSGIHRIEADGEHYRTSGYFTVPPSPQRTPVLFQAGTSGKGKEFAGRYAECVFVQGTTPELTARSVADIRRQAESEGRDPSALKLMAGLTVSVAATAAEAEHLRAEYERMQTDEIAATLYAGNTGIDLLTLDPDRSLEQLVEDGRVGQMGQSNIDRFRGRGDAPAPTVREILAQLRPRGTRGFQVVGDGESVADQIEDLAARTGLDGFLIEPIFDPHDLQAFASLVMPVLRERGRIPESPRTGTLREQLGQASPRLDERHPLHPAGRESRRESATERRLRVS